MELGNGNSGHKRLLAKTELAVHIFTARPPDSRVSCLIECLDGTLNRPGFDAAIFFEKDRDYAQEVTARSP